MPIGFIHAKYKRLRKKMQINDDSYNDFINTQPYIVLVGSLNCMRHKPELGIGRLMQAGKASVLCPTVTDYSTGRYINQLYDAIVEISTLRNVTDFKVITGCQWEIISTDGSLLVQRLKDEQELNVVISEEGHLDYGID